MFLRIRCPRCGKIVSKERLYCPFCNANIYSPYQTRLGLDSGVATGSATEEKSEGAPLWQQVVKVVLVLLFFIALIFL
ncbi:MAG: hypothetical protein WC375_09645 [Methanomassiliicoccales archaeon]|jgi:uncharacterized OB-fold protein